METYERYNFIAERAEGMYLYDEKGDAYLGVAVNSPGNRNEKVVAAVKDQVDDIMHTFNYPYTVPQALLAKKICDTIGRDHVLFDRNAYVFTSDREKSASNERLQKRSISGNGNCFKAVHYIGSLDLLNLTNIWCWRCNSVDD